jgi:hypothetical protein
MLTMRETTYALFGAWRLAHFDLQGTAYFEGTAAAALRSFWVALILLPAHVVLVLLRLVDRPVAVDGWTVFMVEALAYVVGWTAFPVAMHWVARLLDREREYFAFIAMSNWSAVLQMLLFLPVTALTAGRMLPVPVLHVINLAMMLALLAYAWFVARAGLRIGGFAAAGVVALDLVLSLLIGDVSDALTPALRAGIVPPA